MMNNFLEELKLKVINIINENKSNEVTIKTKKNQAGVYMLYIESFDDDKIIPFYIGETDDFQRRHKEHFEQLLALNRLDNSCYKYALKKGLYSGSYKACKIFSYMVNHRCDLEDLHMIIIEDVEIEAFNNLIKYYQYGYNIFNWFLLNGHFSTKQKEKFLSNVEDMEFFKKFKSYQITCVLDLFQSLKVKLNSILQLIMKEECGLRHMIIVV